METIARIITRYREFERLYLRGTQSEMEMMLKDALTRLYAEILTHLARAVSYYRERSMGEFIDFLSLSDMLLPRCGRES